MRTRARRYPVLRGADEDHREPVLGDDLDAVLRDIHAELRADNDLRRAGYEPGGRTSGTVRQQYQARGGSRFAGEHASPDTLAAGGSIVPEPERRTRSTGRGGGLTGVMRKALAEATPSAGGYLVPPEVHDEIVSMLRNRAAVLGMGVRVIPVKKQLLINYLSSGATAYWTPENAAAVVSEETFSQGALLAPRDLTAMVPVSDRMLRDAAETPDLETIVRQDMAEVLALRADLAFLRGTGAAGEPVGVRNTPGLTPAPDLGADGATPTYDNLMDQVAALRAINAPFQNPGWVFNGRLLNTLEKVKDTTGRYLREAGLLEFDPRGGSGRLLGYPFRTTGQVPVNVTKGASNDTTEVYFSSDWSEAFVGQEQELVIEASNDATYWDGTQWVSAWQNRQHVFRSVWTIDFGLRRPQLFTVMTGVRP
jgi:HK97 family phage major capsid protein